jgi:hypothetical protein
MAEGIDGSGLLDRHLEYSGPDPLDEAEETDIPDPDEFGGAGGYSDEELESMADEDAQRAGLSEQPAPGRWVPEHEAFTREWIDAAGAAINGRRTPTDEQPLSVTDMWRLLRDEDRLSDSRRSSREEAGQRANEAINLYLSGQYAKVLSVLAPEGRTYTMTPDGRLGNSERLAPLAPVAPAPIDEPMVAEDAAAEEQSAVGRRSQRAEQHIEEQETTGAGPAQQPQAEATPNDSAPQAPGSRPAASAETVEPGAESTARAAVDDTELGASAADEKPVLDDGLSQVAWGPTSEPFRAGWFDKVKAATAGAGESGGLSRGDLISLLSHENARVVTGAASRQDAGERANAAVAMFLDGRGGEIPSMLAGEGLVYVRSESAGWSAVDARRVQNTKGTAWDSYVEIFADAQALLRERLGPEQAEPIITALETKVAALQDADQRVANEPAPVARPATPGRDSAEAFRGTYKALKEHAKSFYNSPDLKRLEQVLASPGAVVNALREGAGAKAPAIERDGRWKRFLRKTREIAYDVAGRTAAKLARGMGKVDQVAQKLLGKLASAASSRVADLRGEAPTPAGPAPAAKVAGAEQAQVAGRGMPGVRVSAGRTSAVPEQTLPKDAAVLAGRSGGAER